MLGLLDEQHTSILINQGVKTLYWFSEDKKKVCTVGTEVQSPIKLSELEKFSDSVQNLISQH